MSHPMTRDYFWPAYLVVTALFLWLWIDQMETDRVIEAGTLDAVVVTRTDPLPCLSDPAVRAACERQGCECRGER